MKKQFIFSILFSLCVITTIAQQIPFGSCGIVCIYDATGARTKRVYFCNNGGPYPSFVNPAPSDTNVFARNISKIANTDATREIFKNDKITQEELKNATFQPVNALYPNPTTGIFFITFSKPLENATINILDINSKIIKTYNATGNKLTCDVSNFASGNYFVRITEKNQTITKKIIKQ
jgi:hypothetical protein